jgi:hypothetical protein
LSLAIIGILTRQDQAVIPGWEVQWDGNLKADIAVHICKFFTDQDRL